MVLYSVHDVVAGVFSEPVCEYNDDTAIRGFIEFASKFQYKNDVELVKVGDWDNRTGVITPYANYEVVYRGYNVEWSEDNGSSDEV